MELVVAAFAGISLIIIIIVSAILFMQNQSMRNDMEVTLRDIVDQINYANRYAYKFDKLQENNIKNLDENIAILKTRLDTLYPNNQYVCLGTTCMDKYDLARLRVTSSNSVPLPAPPGLAPAPSTTTTR